MLIMERLPELGRALADLRKLCGMSITTCARRMGITASRLQLVEEGDIDDELLETAARAFDLDVNELREGYVAAVGSALFFYASADLQVDSRDLHVIERAMREGRAVARLSVNHRRHHFAPIHPPRNAERRDAARQGYALARQVRDVLDLRDEPLGDMRRLLEEQLEVPVLVDAFHSEGLRAIAVLDAGRSAAAIVLAEDDDNRRENPVLARIYLAHELCHILFDPSIRGGIRISLDENAQKPMPSRGHMSGEFELLESRAKGFQAELLLPFNGIQALLGAPQEVLTPSVACELVQRTREHFGTPWELTTYHLRNHRFIHERLTNDVRSAGRRPSVRLSSTTLPKRGEQSIIAAHLSSSSQASAEALAEDARATALDAVREVLHHAVGQAREAIDAEDFERAIAVLADRAAQADEAGVLGDVTLALIDPYASRLPEFLVWGLEQTDLEPALESVLIHGTEHAQILDVELRARMVKALHRRAVRLLGGADPETLWSALRRYCSMVPLSETESLLDFLGPDAPRTTMMVVLQGIVSIFSREPCGRIVLQTPLGQRVHALAVEAISPERVQSSEDAALAFCTFQASAALADPETPALFAQFERLGRRGLTEHARKFLAELSAMRVE